MTEATPNDKAKPKNQPGAGAQAPDPKSSTPAADDAKRQDKTKDKPDSGQNEDG
ncbi:MAG: hypothetical protein ACRYGP_08125 [Janthinobacterium lividum]